MDDILSWSARRQLIILGLIIAVLAIPFSYALFNYLYKPPTCFDGKQNGGEFGVDCGGSCALLCEEQVTDMIVLWSRALKVKEGVYDAVALVENPNFRAGISQISYVFRFYDTNNAIISEREGVTHINPNEQFVIYEPAVLTGDKIPARTFFEFTSQPIWISTVEGKYGLFTKNERFQDIETKPRLRATLVNPSLEDLKDAVVTVLLFDKDDNAIAVGKTEVDFLPKRSEKDITFVWPQKFERPPEVCTSPLDIMLVFDRSGSMNDDSINPPQPLTDAKNAAQSFVDTLSFEDQVGVVSFATEATFPIDQTLSLEHVRAKEALERIMIFSEEEDGFTNLGDAIEKAVRELLSIRSNQDARRIMVILTDGLANAPNPPGGEIYAKQKIEEVKAEDIISYVIGLGNLVNADFLANEISSGKEKYYPAPQNDDLFRVYREISRVVCPERVYPFVTHARVNMVK